MNPMVTAAQTIVAEIKAAGSTRDFEHTVAAFSHTIGKVPDFRPVDTTAADLEALRQLADEVVELIEVRLEDERDRSTVRRHLADIIYRIRRHQEEMEIWRRHFGV